MQKSGREARPVYNGAIADRISHPVYMSSNLPDAVVCVNVDPAIRHVTLWRNNVVRKQQEIRISALCFRDANMESARDSRGSGVAVGPLLVISAVTKWR